MTNKWLFCLLLAAAILLAASLTLGGAQRGAYPETPTYNSIGALTVIHDRAVARNRNHSRYRSD
jgi:hypothetical protein